MRIFPHCDFYYNGKASCSRNQIERDCGCRELIYPSEEPLHLWEEGVLCVLYFF